MSDAMGSRNTCKTFSTDIFDWQIQSKNFPVEKLSRRKLSRKRYFSTVKRKPDLGFSRKRPFSDKSDYVRNGLSPALAV